MNPCKRCGVLVTGSKKVLLCVACASGILWHSGHSADLIPHIDPEVRMAESTALSRLVDPYFSAMLVQAQGRTKERVERLTCPITCRMMDTSICDLAHGSCTVYRSH